jgi:hypothetical protein
MLGSGVQRLGVCGGEALAHRFPPGFEAGEGVGVYGDAAYGAEELLERLDSAAIYNGLKAQPLARRKATSPRIVSTLTWTSSP